MNVRPRRPSHAGRSNHDCLLITVAFEIEKVESPKIWQGISRTVMLLVEPHPNFVLADLVVPLGDRKGSENQRECNDHSRSTHAAKRTCSPGARRVRLEESERHGFHYQRPASHTHVTVVTRPFHSLRLPTPHFRATGPDTRKAMGQ